MRRRNFIPLAGIAAAAGYASLKLPTKEEKPSDGPPGKSPVAIVKARSYNDDLVSRMLEGVRACGLDVRGKRVLLKPNLVEFDSATVINTDAAVIAAAYELFQKLGAAEVRIGEGPGHRVTDDGSPTSGEDRSAGCNRDATRLRRALGSGRPRWRETRGSEPPAPGPEAARVPAAPAGPRAPAGSA